MNTVTSPSEKPVPSQGNQMRGCLFYVKRGLKWLGIVLVALVLLGVSYQTIASEIDKRAYSPRGQLYTVNNHQIHLVCAGEGSPAVILQAGASAESLWWYWVQNRLIEQTQVCSFDRPGMGWSEPVSGSRDVLTIDAELHALLEQAGISAPYVMAGHSFGSILTRVYAEQYVDQIAGIVLIDSQPVTPKHFASNSEYDQYKSFFDVSTALFWVMYRMGLARLTYSGDALKWGYPLEVATELAALRSRYPVLDAYYAENVPAFPALQEASAAAEDLGDMPMMVLWASDTYESNQRNPSLRPVADELASYSSNSATRIIDGADHATILGNQQYAQQVTDAILDVMEAAQTGEALAQ